MRSPSNIDLVGTWRLVGAEEWLDGVQSFGREIVEPQHGGYISYTAPDADRQGHMQVVLDRRCFMDVSAGSRFGSTPIIAYAGPYSRDGDTVVHHLRLCSLVDDIGSDYVRRIEVDGDRLVLCTPPEIKDGRSRVMKLIWTRVLS
jgi:hypothetical protein